METNGTGKPEKKNPRANEATERAVANRKKRFLKALGRSLGVVSAACEMAKISRSIYYYWMKEDLEFKKQVEDMQEVSLDFAETCLFNQMRSGNSNSTTFYLKTKGKGRGYIETAVSITKDVSDLEGLTDAELLAIIKGNPKPTGDVS